ncbi:MAG: nicotinate mononucleotide-dependent phosphoribosyltransferase CobT [Cyanobacteria bacterium P01_F01_bin.33]
MQSASRSPYWRAHIESDRAQAWCESVLGLRPAFVCCMGFTETALIPGISAAGATPEARRYTAIADAEVLLHGKSDRLPTAPDGYPSPVVISRAICEALNIPVQVVDCGLPERLPEMAAALPELATARCLSTGRALDLNVVEQLWQSGWEWGQRLKSANTYLVIGECVAGGTTTALAVLLGLGIAADGKVNSSHPSCNHAQKQEIARQGLGNQDFSGALDIIAAVGDPMQPFVAGLAVSASRHRPVLLAGGTQMLAVWAVMERVARDRRIEWRSDRVVVGTTRWVAADATGDTVGLARMLAPVPLLATELSFAPSRYPPLQAYERGFVKAGVGAGGLAIAANLYRNWQQKDLLEAIETTYENLLKTS